MSKGNKKQKDDKANMKQPQNKEVDKPTGFSVLSAFTNRM